MTLKHCPGCTAIIFSINTHGDNRAQTKSFDADLKALEDRARGPKTRKVRQLGERVIAAGADTLSADELVGALIVLAETKEAGKREAWAKRGAGFFKAGRDEIRQQLTATLKALLRNRAVRNRHQVARARHDMRTWQVEHRSVRGISLNSAASSSRLL